MNSTSVAIICVTLIATPAGYAVERLYHERITSAVERSPVNTTPALDNGLDPLYAGSAAWVREQTRITEALSRPGRV
jgi:hypothetical protein